MKTGYNQETSNLEFEVEDTGLGIEQEDLAKLFKFFGKLSKSKAVNKGGMGLGLTISKMIVNQLGGEILVSSTFNQGSKFSFNIPIHDKEEEAPRRITAAKSKKSDKALI